MRGLWLEDGELRYRSDIPVPLPRVDDALVQVRLAGICGTDLEMLRGYYPFTGVIGHEFVGEVMAAPDQAWIGKRVVGDINLTCGSCPACQRGHSTHCERRSVLGLIGHEGVFAEYLALPLRNLHRVPEHVPDEAAVFTEPLAAAVEILEQIPCPPQSHVLVVGAGRLGQLIAQVLGLTGCDMSVVARHANQRELLSAGGINTIEESQVQDGAYDLVIEATGASTGFALARRALRPRGTLVMKSTIAGEVQVNLSALVVDEITLVGSRCGPFEPALRLMASGRIDPRPLIQGSYPFCQGLEAFDHAARPGALKILLSNGITRD